MPGGEAVSCVALRGMGGWISPPASLPICRKGVRGQWPSVVPSTWMRAQTPSSREAPGLAMAKGLAHLPIGIPGFP